MNINCGNAPEARDGYFTTYYFFNKIVLDVITEKFDIQVDKNTKNQAALLHNDIPGYNLPTIDFVQTTTDQDKDVSILEEDNSQIYAYLDNVLVHIVVLLHCGCISLIPFIEFMNLEFGTTHQVQMC